jgi:serine/threonine protein phosphatase 1
VSTELAFVGDIHGNLRAVQGLWDALVRREVPHVIFLGDYINKGARSAGVLQELISHAKTGRATLLAGNHEKALLDALDRQDLSGFLKMGGAMTIRSYVGGRVGPDVLGDFLTGLPPEHLEALRRMPPTYETEDLIAQHLPSRSSTSKFRISAHVPVGDLPRIGHRSAQLDTGCGTNSGRLTVLLWPSLDYIQVDNRGAVVTG